MVTQSYDLKTDQLVIHKLHWVGTCISLTLIDRDLFMDKGNDTHRMKYRIQQCYDADDSAWHSELQLFVPLTSCPYMLYVETMKYYHEACVISATHNAITKRRRNANFFFTGGSGDYYENNLWCHP